MPRVGRRAAARHFQGRNGCAEEAGGHAWAAGPHLQHLLEDEVEPVGLVVVLEALQQRGEHGDAERPRARHLCKLPRQPHRQQAQHVARQARHALDVPLLHITAQR